MKYSEVQSVLDDLLQPEVLNKALPVILEKIVKRSVERHALCCDASIRGWALQWLNGENRSVASARIALKKAHVLENAAAAEAIWAAGMMDTQTEAADIAEAAAMAEVFAINLPGTTSQQTFEAELQWQLEVIHDALETDKQYTCHVLAYRLHKNRKIWI